MARDFTKNTANDIDLGNNKISAAINGAAKVSLFAWAYPDTFDAGANDNRLLGVRIGVNLTGITFCVNGSGATKVLRVGARSATTDSFQTKDATSSFTTGAWHDVGGVINFASKTITPYYQGTAEGGGSVTFANTTYVNGSPDNTEAVGSDVGNPGASGPQWDGRIAEVAVWVSDIGASGFALLHQAYSPLCVNPDSLVFYMPLLGNFSPEIDLISGINGTIEGTVAKADHPRIIYPE